MYYVYESRHHFEYKTREPVPVKEIIKSLQGFERIVAELPHVINALTHDNAILGAELYVERIETGSLLEDLIVRLFFGSEEEFHEWIARLRQYLKMDNPTVQKLFIGASVSALILYGVSSALPKDTPEPRAGAISGNQGVVIQFIGDHLNLDAEAVQQTIEQAVKDKKSLARGAVEVVQAGKSDREADLSIDGEDRITIKAAAIQAAPRQYVPPEPDRKVEEYENARVELRALDRDSDTTGWSCIVPGIADARIKLILDPAIDREALGREQAVMANIAVTSRYDTGKKRYVLHEVFLRHWTQIQP